MEEIEDDDDEEEETQKTKQIETLRFIVEPKQLLQSQYTHIPNFTPTSAGMPGSSTYVRHRF